MSFAELIASRDAAKAAYLTLQAQVETHPKHLFRNFPPTMMRRYVDTGRLKEVKVVVEGVRATVSFRLDDVRCENDGWYNTREGEWDFNMRIITPHWEAVGERWREDDKELEAFITEEKERCRKDTDKERFEERMLVGVLIMGSDPE